jgi:hypothetical protein
MGPPLETSCFKGSWKETPYSELANTKLRRKWFSDPRHLWVSVAVAWNLAE